MTIRKLQFFLCVAIVSSCALRASAVTLFSDNFNTNTSANWTINKAPTATDPNKQKAEFAFDYSTFGIPAAPGSGDTLGLRLRANVPVDGSGNDVTTRPAGTLSGLSLSPLGQNFGTNYIMTVYAWSNFFGAPNANGLADNAASEGGTANILFAAGTVGTVPLVVGNGTTVPLATNGAMDGIGFVTTGDGGLAPDWRVYPKSGTIVPSTTPNVYAAAPAGSATASSNADAFYTAKFPTQTAPAVQQTLATAEYGSDAFPVMAGNMQTGSFGFAWHKVVVTKNGNTVSWDIDDNRIAQYDISALTMGGNNVAIGVSDVNASTARHPSLVFTVFDNLTVTDVAVTLPGDNNGDGKVDALDYLGIRKQFPDITSGAGLAAYTTWRQNFGSGTGSGSGLGGAAVPEPSSLLLLLTSGCCCWGTRRRS